MKHRLFHLFLIIQVCQICQSDQNLNRYHAIKKRNVVVRNNQHPWRYPPRTTRAGAPSINSELMNKLRKVLVETLKSLSHVNSKLAHYFVQHHPSLENVYRKLSAEKTIISKQQSHDQHKGVTVTTVPSNRATSRILIQRQSTNKTRNQQTTPRATWSANQTARINDSTTPAVDTQSKPIFVGLSEFERTPMRKVNSESMSAQNISTSSLNANKVRSKIVRANNIVAKNVVISATRNTNNFQYHKQFSGQALPATFSIRNSGGSGFGLLEKQPPVQPRNNRRHFFPPRQDGRNGDLKSHRITVYPRMFQSNDKTFGNQQPIGSHNTFSQPVKVKQTTSGTQRHTNPVLPQSIPRSKPRQIYKRRNFWHDSWSDYDSDDDFYDNTSEEPAQQPGMSGTNINAKAIQAKSMFARKVRAKSIRVNRVVADDVIVSARYGA